MIGGYGKIIALDKGKFTEGVFDGIVTVQEKIDGSQVSFGVEVVSTPEAMSRVPIVRSKNQVVQHGNKMFQMVLDWVEENAHLLNAKYIYRGEAVTSVKHNTLKYDRIPKNGVILFDIYDRDADKMLGADALEAEGARIGLEVVPTRLCLFNHGHDIGIAELKNRLDTESVLGGCKVEGYVVKAYDKPDPSFHGNHSDRQAFLKVKLVSDAFKEIHHTSWKERNPNGKDVISNLIEVYATPARMNKAVQHLRDADTLTDTPKDIGALIKEVCADVTEECKDEILDALWKHFGKKVIGGVGKAMPDYYKTEVLGLV